MYIISILFVLLIIFSIRGKISTEKWLSKESTHSLRGIMAIGVLFSHLAGKVNHPVPYFNGAAFVGMFFLLSGYGLAQSCIVKPNYLDGFLNKRICKIFYPYLVFVAICLIINCWIIKQISVGTFFRNFIKGNPVSNSWYVWVIMFLYISFWICFHKCKKTDYNSITKGQIVLCGFTLIYIAITWFVLKWYDWWYKTCILFLIGVSLGFHKEKVLNFISRKYTLCFACSIIFLLFAWYSPAFLNHIERIIHVSFQKQYIWLINDFLIGLSFPLLCLLVDIRLHFINYITDFLGKYSYELYLVHGEI